MIVLSAQASMVSMIYSIQLWQRSILDLPESKKKILRSLDLIITQLLKKSKQQEAFINKNFKNFLKIEETFNNLLINWTVLQLIPNTPEKKSIHIQQPHTPKQKYVTEGLQLFQDNRRLSDSSETNSSLMSPVSTATAVSSVHTHMPELQKCYKKKTVTDELPRLMLAFNPIRKLRNDINKLQISHKISSSPNPWHK